MSRPKKKQVKLTPDSVMSLAQEAYNELVEQRSSCIRTINENKQMASVEDMHDLVNLNKANTDLFKVIDSTIDKKLAIVKLMSGFVFSKANNSVDDGDGDLSIEDMAMIRDIMNGQTKGDDNEDIEYKI